MCIACASAHAALPGGVARAFHDAGVPLSGVSVVVRESGQPQPLFAHDANRPMNPASVMKIVTTYAALDLLGPDFRWKTEAYLAGKLDRKGTLAGNLVIKGYGDPRITIEQWQAFMRDLRAQGLASITGDLVLDRSYFKLPEHDPAAFDQEPLRPYNVGPDALLVNFKAVRFAFAPENAGNAVTVRADPPLPEIAVSGVPQLVNGDCGDWRATLAAQYVNLGSTAVATFPGRYPQSCGEREWYVALLDHPHYVLGMFTTYFKERGGRFSGTVVEGRPPRNAKPFAVMESAPLYDIVRDVNKLSNNVMARQVFLTLATAKHPPPATPALAAGVVQQVAQRQADRDPRAGARERIGTVATRASDRGGHRAASRVRGRERRARGVRKLARRGGDGRDGAKALPGRQRRRAGAPQDRDARRRARARRLCDQPGGPPVHRRGNRQPSQRVARGARARLPRAVGLPRGRDVRRALRR